MPRPKTAAAAYAQMTLRIPEDLLEQIKVFSETTGAPLNTTMVRILRMGMTTEGKRVIQEVENVLARVGTSP